MLGVDIAIGTFRISLHNVISGAIIRKILAPMKIQLSLSPPPRKKPNLWAWRFSPGERTKKSQAPIKLAQPFPALESRAKHFTDMRLFVSDILFSTHLFQPQTVPRLQGRRPVEILEWVSFKSVLGRFRHF